MNEYKDITVRALRDEQGFIITATNGEGDWLVLVDVRDQDQAYFSKLPLIVDNAVVGDFLMVVFETRAKADAIAESWRVLPNEKSKS